MFQLLMTVMLLSIVVYIYTVIAFNFFRKFYNKGEDGADDYKCHDMFTVSDTDTGSVNCLSRLGCHASYFRLISPKIQTSNTTTTWLLVNVNVLFNLISSSNCQKNLRNCFYILLRAVYMIFI